MKIVICWNSKQVGAGDGAKKIAHLLAKKFGSNSEVIIIKNEKDLERKNIIPDVLFSIGPDNISDILKIIDRCDPIVIGMKDPYENNSVLDYRNWYKIIDIMDTMYNSSLKNQDPNKIIFPIIPPYTLSKKGILEENAKLQNLFENKGINIEGNSLICCIVGGNDPYSKKGPVENDIHGMFLLQDKISKYNANKNKTTKTIFITSNRTDPMQVLLIKNKLKESNGGLLYSNNEKVLYEYSNNNESILLDKEDIEKSGINFYKALLGYACTTIPTIESLSMTAELTETGVPEIIYKLEALDNYNKGIYLVDEVAGHSIKRWENVASYVVENGHASLVSKKDIEQLTDNDLDKLLSKNTKSVDIAEQIAAELYIAIFRLYNNKIKQKQYERYDDIFSSFIRS